MAEEIKAGCARPTGGPVGEKVDDKKETPKQEASSEVRLWLPVGKKAPDFIAPAYQRKFTM